MKHLGNQLNQNNEEQSRINEQRKRRNHDTVLTISDLLASIEGEMDKHRREIHSHKNMHLNNETTTDRTPTHTQVKQSAHRILYDSSMFIHDLPFCSYPFVYDPMENRTKNRRLRLSYKIVQQETCMILYNEHIRTDYRKTQEPH